MHHQGGAIAGRGGKRNQPPGRFHPDASGRHNRIGAAKVDLVERLLQTVPERFGVGFLARPDLEEGAGFRLTGQFADRRRFPPGEEPRGDSSSPPSALIRSTSMPTG